MRFAQNSLLLLVLLICAGAGPCDSPEESATEETAGESCRNFNVICQHTLDIEILSPAETPFEAGWYRFDVIAPDSSAYAVDCYLGYESSNFECDAGHTDLLRASLDLYRDDTIWLRIHGAPPHCTVLVSFDDVLIGRRDIVPFYQLLYPNGEDCAPVCYEGVGAMAVLLP